MIPKDGLFIFKHLTKNKTVDKDYFVGLTFKDFQEALLRIAVKYKGTFNLIGERVTMSNSSQLPPEETDEFNIDSSHKKG